MSPTLNKIENAINELKAGKMLILVDNEDRENEGDLIIPAENATPEVINFMSRFGRGLICLPMLSADFSRLNIPMMAQHNTAPMKTAFGVAIEAARGVTTGISAADRAETIKVAINENSGPQDIVMPGHMFPLLARKGGVLERQGHTEGSVDLARLAGFKAAAVLCEIINDDGTMARRDDLEKFAHQHDLQIISIEDLITYRVHKEIFVKTIASSILPLKNNIHFQIKIVKNTIDQLEHVALISPKLNLNEPPLVRLHSECLTGDVFGSTRCDCGAQLKLAMQEIENENGLILYLRQEGRGIGLGNKIKAYALQDQGLDTVEANHQLGFASDERDYSVAAQILRELGIKRIRLLTNNPNKIAAMERYGVEVVERVPHVVGQEKNNIHYINTKKEKLGHLI